MSVAAAEILGTRRRGKRRNRRYRPSWNPPAETLEVRIVPTTDIWTGGGATGNFSDPNNWQSLTIPQPNDNLDFPAGVANYAPNDDLGLGYGTIAIDSAGYAITATLGISTQGITTTYGGGSSTIANDVTLTGSSQAAVTVASGGLLEFSGAIGGTPGLAITGGGAVLFDGSSPNTYGGSTEVDNGLLMLGKPSGITAVPGDLVIGDGTDPATVQDQANNQLGAGTHATIAASGTLDLNGYNDAVAGMTLHGGTVTTGSGKLALLGDVTDDAAVPLTISGNLALSAQAVTFHVSSGAILELDAAISGTGGLIAQGGGTLALAGSGGNTYQGATEVDTGTLLELDVTSPTLPAIPGSLLINGSSTSATVRELAGAQLGSGTVVTAIGGGTLDLNGHNDSVAALELNGGSVTTGTGTLTLRGDIGVGNDTPQVPSSISGRLALAANVHVSIGSGATLTVGDIAGTGYGLGLDGLASVPGAGSPLSGGALVLAGQSANTYTGKTTVAAGELRLSKPAGVAALGGPLVVGSAGGAAADVIDEADGQLGPGVAVTVYNGAMLGLNGHKDAVGTLVLLGGLVATDPPLPGIHGHLTLDGPVAADSTSSIAGAMTLGDDTTFTVAANKVLTLDGPIDGGFGLTLGYSQTLPDTTVHQGGGTLRMQGTAGASANSYSGVTSVQYGTLELAKAAGTVSIPGALTIGDPVDNNATVRDTADSQLAAATIATIYGGGTLDLNGHADALGGLQLLGQSDGTVVQTGSGRLTLNGQVDDGSTANLTIQGNVTLGGNTTFTAVTGGVLNLDAAIDDGGHGYGLTLAPSQFQPAGNSLSDGGTLVMSGMDSNTYTGMTTVQAGILALDKGCGAVSLAGPLAVGGLNGAAAVVLDEAGGQLDGNADATLNPGGLLELDGFNDAVADLVLNGGTATTGSGVLTIGNDVIDNAVTSTPTLLAANLDLAGPSPEFNIQGGDYLVAQGVLSGSNGFRLTGGGTLKLWGSSASNTYAGPTGIDMGTLILDNAVGTVAIPGDLVIGTGGGITIVRELASGQIAPTSHVTIGYGSLFDLADNNQTIAGLAFNNGVVYLGSGTLTLTGDVTATGWGEIDNNRYVGGPNFSEAAEGRLDLGGARAFGIATGEVLSLNALVTDGSVVKNGQGELDLNDSSNDYAGSTQVNAGRLVADGWKALGQTSGATVLNGATLALQGVNTHNLAITLGGGAGTTDSTLTIDNSNEDAVKPSYPVDTITNLVLDGNATIAVLGGTTETINGLLTGDAVNHRLTVAGGGTLHLGGSVSNDGSIVVNGGNLDISANGPLTGAVTVSGGHLDGSSAIGAVTSTGGTVGALAPYTPQVLTVASLGLDSGSTFAVDIRGNTPGAGGYSQVVSTGAVALGGAALTVNLDGYTPQAGDSFTILHGSSAPAGTFNGLPEGALITAGGYSFRITYKGGAQADDVVLSYVQASTTTLASSSTVATFGQSVTLTATVTAAVGTPVGTVTFTEGSKVLGTVSLTPTGTASLVLSNLSVGYHKIVATYGGASAFTTSASSTLGQVIKQTATTSSLALSAGPITYGQSETITATIAPVAGSGTPTGTVTFYDGSTKLGTVPLTAGLTASLVVGSFSTGSHALTAVYGGDASFLSGTSSATPLSVKPIATNTLLGVTNGSTVLGQATTFVAYVGSLAPSSGSPTGSVTFMDGSTVLGQGNLVNGWASLTTAGLGLGGHGVTAIFAGGANTAASQSTAVVASVSPDSSTTSLVTSTPNAVYGQMVTLTATVGVIAPGTAAAGGKVTFMDGANVIGTASVVGGTATLTTSSLGFGFHYLYAMYGGSAAVAPSWSPAIGQTVYQASTGTGFVSSARVATVGQTITYSAAVAAVAPGGGTPTGTVTFYDGGTILGKVALTGGLAILTVPATGVGSHPITVYYSGDGNYQSSISAILTETVVKAAPQVTAYEQVFPNAVALPTAILAPTPGAPVPTGIVTYYANGKKIGQAALVNGSATILLAGRSVLSQSVTVVYSGDSNYNGSTVVPTISYA